MCVRLAHYAPEGLKRELRENLNRYLRERGQSRERAQEDN